MAERECPTCGHLTTVMCGRSNGKRGKCLNVATAEVRSTFTPMRGKMRAFWVPVCPRHTPARGSNVRKLTERSHPEQSTEDTTNGNV